MRPRPRSLARLIALLVPAALASAQERVPRWQDARLVHAETRLAPARVEAIGATRAIEPSDSLVVAGFHVQFSRGEGHWDITGSVEGDPTPVWVHAQTAVADPDYDGGYLLSPRGPRYPWPALRPLTAMGNSLLVCAGPREGLLCLDARTGAVRWNLTHLWEFERGFIGPSVWSHTVVREGALEWGTLSDEARAELREARDGAFRENLLAGPALVPTIDYRGGASWAIYMMVAQAPSGNFASYRADCTLLEIDARGEVRSLAPMPRLAEPAFSAQGERVLWSMTGGAWASIAPSDSFRSFAGMGPGGPDRRARVDWYRESHYAPPAGTWLVSSWSSPSIAFAPEHAYRAAGGAWIEARDSKRVHFPIQRVERAEGQHQTLVLELPFDGPDLADPETNYSRNQGTFEKLGPYLAVMGELSYAAGEFSLDVHPANGGPTLAGEGRRLVFRASDLVQGK